MHPNFYCSPVNVFVLWLSGYVVVSYLSLIGHNNAKGCLLKNIRLNIIVVKTRYLFYYRFTMPFLYLDVVVIPWQVASDANHVVLPPGVTACVLLSEQIVGVHTAVTCCSFVTWRVSCHDLFNPVQKVGHIWVHPWFILVSTAVWVRMRRIMTNNDKFPTVQRYRKIEYKYSCVKGYPEYMEIFQCFQSGVSHEIVSGP